MKTLDEIKRYINFWKIEKIQMDLLYHDKDSHYEIINRINSAIEALEWVISDEITKEFENIRKRS